MREQDTQEIPGAGLVLDERFSDLVEADIFRMDRSVYLTRVKPVVDVILGVIGLLLTVPLLVTIALAVRVEMGSPVLLHQRRMGRFNVPFTLYKFRTMEPDRRTTDIDFVGHDRRITHKSAGDPRITSLGAWLRSTRLDELPQLLNVVRGELSVVGPRPELVSVVRAEYEPWQYRRHAVRPGLTGPWQIADRGEKRLHECTESELPYLDQVSLGTDLKIMARTIPALLRRSGI